MVHQEEVVTTRCQSEAKEGGHWPLVWAKGESLDLLALIISAVWWWGRPDGSGQGQSWVETGQAVLSWGSFWRKIRLPRFLFGWLVGWFFLMMRSSWVCGWENREGDPDDNRDRKEALGIGVSLCNTLSRMFKNNFLQSKNKLNMEVSWSISYYLRAKSGECGGLGGWG